MTMKKDGIQTRNRKISAKLKKMNSGKPISELPVQNPNLFQNLQNAETLRLFGYSQNPPMAHAPPPYAYQFQHPIHFQ